MNERLCAAAMFSDIDINDFDIDISDIDIDIFAWDLQTDSDTKSSKSMRSDSTSYPDEITNDHQVPGEDDELVLLIDQDDQVVPLNVVHLSNSHRSISPVVRIKHEDDHTNKAISSTSPAVRAKLEDDNANESISPSVRIKPEDDPLNNEAISPTSPAVKVKQEGEFRV